MTYSSAVAASTPISATVGTGTMPSKSDHEGTIICSDGICKIGRPKVLRYGEDVNDIVLNGMISCSRNSSISSSPVQLKIAGGDM